MARPQQYRLLMAVEIRANLSLIAKSVIHRSEAEKNASATPHDLRTSANYGMASLGITVTEM